ncbi:MAG: serine/threonine protein kinase [Deltaproteobacteria bacterium]|nr:serine/threonine protein kinase [Deltaproteobacteria bacterium]
MAEVYKARIFEGARMGQTVALKRLTPKLTEDTEAVDLFTGEADISRLLKHPNIVEVLEAGCVGDLYYLVMEYVDGRDLAHVLAKFRERRIWMPVPFALYIVRSVLDALAYAHHAKGPTGLPLNIVHCDVSPSNLFISRLGEIKLGDFGIAKVRAMGDGDPQSTLWGKLAYLAPEQLERAPLTPQADLWGASAVLYEALANQRALLGHNNEALQDSLRNLKIAPVSSLRKDLPEGLDDVLLRSLSKDPRDRFQTAAEFNEALKPFHDEAVGSALGIASVVRGLFRQ